MKKAIIIFELLFFVGSLHAFSQSNITSLKDTLNSIEIDPLRPAKAAFYSAILPGLGQAYNKKYWKIPLVYGAIGTSTYFYIDSQKKYNVYRDEYKRRLEGKINEDLYFRNLSESQLIAAQKQFKRNSDLSVLFIAGFYILNIIDANIEAALSQFNVNSKLAFKPIIGNSSNISTQNLSIVCVYSF
ncbi:DUF5683 domain-containing protein (plasmid) [Flavobacterium sp. TMP13]|uniref:DUF5683 domain-containing protein n=1 Tax=Flavobacterium sp. TMP13 TaxID=3425950 RepID=UPI003D777308